MRARWLGTAAITLLIAYRLLAVSNFQGGTALGIARSQGTASTLLGTVVPILPRLLPFVAVLTAWLAVAVALYPGTLKDQGKSVRTSIGISFGLLAVSTLTIAAAGLMSDSGGHASIWGLFFAGLAAGWDGAVVFLALVFGVPGLAIVIKSYLDARKTGGKKFTALTWSERWALTKPLFARRATRALGATLRWLSSRSAITASGVESESAAPPADRSQDNPEAGGRTKPPEPGDLDFMRIVLAGVGVVAVTVSFGFPDAQRGDIHLLEVSRTMWLPEEVITLDEPTDDGASAIDGFVLDGDSDWFTVLTAEDRTIVYFEKEHVLTRTVCESSESSSSTDELPVWHAEDAVPTPLPRCADLLAAD